MEDDCSCTTRAYRSEIRIAYALASVPEILPCRISGSKIVASFAYLHSRGRAGHKEHSHDLGNALTEHGGACENSGTTFDIWPAHRTSMAPDGTPNLPCPCRVCHNRHSEYILVISHRSAERIVIPRPSHCTRHPIEARFANSLSQPRRRQSHIQKDYVNLCVDRHIAWLGP
jgi:hypothetical protein